MSELQPNSEDMKAHLHFLFDGAPAGAMLEIAWSSVDKATGKHKLNKAQLFAADMIDMAAGEALLQNRRGSNVYVGVQPRKAGTAPFVRAGDKDVLSVLTLYADFDVPGTLENGKHLWEGLAPSFLVITGVEPHARGHAYWKLDTPLSPTEPSIRDGQQSPRCMLALSSMAAALNADNSIINPSRVLRLAGSVAWPAKDGRVVELTRIAPLKRPGPERVSIEHIEKAYTSHADSQGRLSAAPSSASAVLTTYPTAGALSRTQNGNDPTQIGYSTGLGLKLSRNDHELQTLLDESCEPGKWHTSMRGAVASMVGRGYSDEKITLCCAPYCDGGINDPDLGMLIATAHRKWPQAQLKANGQGGAIVTRELMSHSAPSPRVILTEPAFPIDAAQLELRDWIVQDTLLKKNVTTLVAPPGVGKSLLTLQIAIMVASGEPWGNYRVRKRSDVVILNTEDDITECRRRLYAAADTMGVSQDKLGGIHIVSNPDDLVIATVNKEGAVIRTPVFDGVVDAVRRLNVGLVVVDPFAETFVGDENSNSDLKSVAMIWRDVARFTNTSLLLVHHTKKYAQGMAGDPDAARGASALVGVVRVLLTLFNMTETEASMTGVTSEKRSRYVRLDDGKKNLSPLSGKAQWFEKVSYQLPQPGLEPADWVGVLAPWKPPGVFDDFTANDLNTALEDIDKGPRDEGGKFTGELFTDAANVKNANRWAGKVLMEVLGCDEAKAKMILKEWKKTGLLVAGKYKRPGHGEGSGVRVDRSKMPGSETHETM